MGLAGFWVSVARGLGRVLVLPIGSVSAHTLGGGHRFVADCGSAEFRNGGFDFRNGTGFCNAFRNAAGDFRNAGDTFVDIRNSFDGVTGYLLFPFFGDCLCHSGAFLAGPVPCSADDAFERFQDYQPLYLRCWLWGNPVHSGKCTRKKPFAIAAK